MRYLNLILLSLCLWSCQNKAENTPPETVALPAEETEMTSAAVDTDNRLTAEEEASGWKLLFDGKTTDQWRGYNKGAFPDKGWKVVDGEIIVEYSGTEEEGYGGDIITKESFENFELQLDFALSDTSNSGIFYLIKEAEGVPIWHNAPEYQLLDDETYKVIYEGLTDKQLTGANYDMHAQTVNYSHPIGEWNTARIVKNGFSVEHWLNDSLVVAYNLFDEDWKERYEGSKFSEYADYARNIPAPIGLQDHGHICRFKNIKIRVF